MAKVAILGYGSQGASIAGYYRNKGYEITVCDKNEALQLPEGAKARLGKEYLENLGEFDILVRSPALHPQQIIDANRDVSDLREKITTNTNEFMRVCPTKNIIGITGTKGKGTTSTLIAKMLEYAGYRVHLGGNIGTPPLVMLEEDIQPEDWVVLELANFQLIDVKHSPKIAVCVQVVPEHLDWHSNLNEYVTAKQQLFKWQKAGDTAVFYAPNALSMQIAAVSKGSRIPYFKYPGARAENGRIIIEDTPICDIEEIGLPGEHNRQNICAAVTAVWQVDKNSTAIRDAIVHLTGLPFRIELRREMNGVKFYNDSFATGPGATIAAINTVKEPKVLILGGYDRGLELTELGKVIKSHQKDIRHMILIGDARSRLAEEFEVQGITNYTLEASKKMESIVNTAANFARKGDAVLLSPSFASFGMFKNFEERGNLFNQAVANL